MQKVLDAYAKRQWPKCPINIERTFEEWQTADRRRTTFGFKII